MLGYQNDPALWNMKCGKMTIVSIVYYSINTTVTVLYNSTVTELLFPVYFHADTVI